MNKEIREQIALMRYKLISPVLAEPNRVQNEYFRKIADTEHDFAHYGVRRYTVSTFKAWLRRYRKYGFVGLRPKKRADAGRPRRVKGPVLDAVRAKCKAFPDKTIQKLHEEMTAEGLLGDPPVTYVTLSRIIAMENLKPAAGRTDKRKRYEAAEANDLWLCDFMHGPVVRCGKKNAKAILCAIIDDHSRMIVGYAFSPHETISALTVVLKDALSAFGVPKRFYVDNGSAFSCDLLVKACAQAGISLIHSKPYDSPSRGKIERFFRTVRDRFLPDVAPDITLDELNSAFDGWLGNDYHHKNHSGIQSRPIDRYHASTGRIQIKRFGRTELDEIFLVRHERSVNNDATISFQSHIYEVPAAYIRQRIEIRHPVDDPTDLALYDNGIRVATLKLVNVKENARTFVPTTEATPISYATGQVRS